MSTSEASAASPRKDLASAVMIAAFAIAVMGLSVSLERPEGLLTAPGLLPFVTGLALLAMALALGIQALRAGAARGFVTALVAGLRALPASAEDRRAGLLGALVLGYVYVVGQISFELRLATERFEFLLSGFELVSIFVITSMLKLFWRASLLRCFAVALVTVESLALSFRYGFNLIMPEAF